MKKPSIKRIAAICLTVAIIVATYVILKQTNINNSPNNKAQALSKTSIKKNSMDERTHWGNIKIVEYTKLLKSTLGKKDEEPNLIYMTLFHLGKLGTSQSVQVLEEYLNSNKKELPAIAPNADEMGDITIYMSYSNPITPEGRVLGTIVHLIASGVPEAELGAMDAVQEIKARYHGTKYGNIFSEHLDKAVDQGKAIAPYNAELRLKPNLVK